VVLTPADIQTLEALVDEYPNVGNRYSEGSLKLVNR
jgi:hypothetical protein